MLVRSLLVAVLAVSALTSCTTKLTPPDLGDLYNQAAASHDLDRNAVIVIPGILGSKLHDPKTGQVVWGAFAGDYADPRKPEGARQVALPMEYGVALDGMRDGVEPNGSLDRLRVEIAGLPIELNAYLGILGTLGVGGYRDQGLGMAGAIDYGDDHYTCFQFDYDWRRDNIENARRLGAFIAEKRKYVQQKLEEKFGVKDHDVHFDIVAHSMGGLLTRYFLRYGDAVPAEDGSAPPLTWAGAEHVDRVILVGTPNAGSAEAVTQLVDGIKFAFFLPSYNPAVLGTMPAIYQLLPRPRHKAVIDASGDAIDVLDPEVWRTYGWGLADPEQDETLAVLLPDVDDAAERRRIALDHQAKCLDRARAFYAALDVPADLPDGLRLSIVAGDAIETAAQLTVDETGTIRITNHAPGDGTVLRTSALMDERVGGEWTRGLVSPVPWTGVMFLFQDHLGLTSDPTFSDNVLYELLEAP